MTPISPITCPPPEGTCEPIAQLETQRSASRQPATILIVDDDAAQVLALQYRLSQQGFEVLTAYDGQTALKTAFSERPHLILLDLRLPDMEGVEVCSRLADAPETCCTPVIVLSAMARPDIVRQLRSAGGQYYVRKPYDPNVLLALIERALLESQG